MWRYCITRLLSRKYPELVIPQKSSRRDWNRFLDTHYRRGWNVNVSRVMDNATHMAVYFGSYLKKPPVPMSRLEHYAGQDKIGLRYNSHRTKREEYLVMRGDEFMERFSWHVADKGLPMVRYYGFLIFTQRIERNNLPLRTRIKRLARKTICFSRSVKINEKVIGSVIEKNMFY